MLVRSVVIDKLRQDFHLTDGERKVKPSRVADCCCVLEVTVKPRCRVHSGPRSRDGIVRSHRTVEARPFT